MGHYGCSFVIQVFETDKYYFKLLQEILSIESRTNHDGVTIYSSKGDLETEEIVLSFSDIITEMKQIKDVRYR